MDDVHVPSHSGGSMAAATSPPTTQRTFERGRAATHTPTPIAAINHANIVRRCGRTSPANGRWRSSVHGVGTVVDPIARTPTEQL